MGTHEQVQAETMREMLTQLRIDVAVMKSRTNKLPETLELLSTRVQKNETNVKWLQRGMIGGVPVVGVLLTTVLGFLGISVR